MKTLKQIITARDNSRNPEGPPPLKKTGNGNPGVRERRKFFPGVGGGKKWREFDITSDGKCALITVVEKGLEISSKPRRPKIKNDLEKNALMKLKMLFVTDERRN